MHHVKGTGPRKRFVILGPFHRPRPYCPDLRALLKIVPILDLEILVDDIAVRPESQRIGDPKPKAIITPYQRMVRGPRLKAIGCTMKNWNPGANQKMIMHQVKGRVKLRQKS